jgi:serine/threonine-protein kinase
VSDIYSVGALAYFMLSGRSPFEGKGPVQMLMAHLGEVPPSVASLRPEVAAPLDVLVMRCLAKRPEDRYASAAELERALHSIALPEPLGRRVDSIAALLDERQVTR